MTKNRKMANSSARRDFGPLTRSRTTCLALFGLALFGLIQSGCQIDGCSTCGGFGSKLTNGVQALGARIGKHFDKCKGGESCGCEDGGAMVDSGMPLSPGGMVVPGSGTILPAPSIESAPLQLSPNDSTGPGGANSGSSRNAPNGMNKSAYTTMVPRNGQGTARRSDVSRALLSTADRPSRPADPADLSDLLENIPPVDLPNDVTRNARKASTSPAAPVITIPTLPVVIPGPSPAPPALNPAEKVSAAEGPGALLPPITASLTQAPGIRRFASVAPSLGGGSAPSLEGLDWLKEKGYHTFVDLRRSSEIDANFVDAVYDRNMVYISLPIVANKLDVSRLARFDELIAQSGNRPLYFCDSDGTRAGLVWYVHLRFVNEEDSQAASAKAEEIGLTSVEIRLAEQYLLTHKPRAKAASAKVALGVSPEGLSPRVDPKAPPELPINLPTALPAGPVAPTTPATPPAPTFDPPPVMLPGEDRPQASSGSAPWPNRYRDMASWRPVAALVLAGVGVPLACWSKSAISESFMVRRRASLPAATRQSLEALPSSDV